MSREEKLIKFNELINSFSDTFSDRETIYHYTTAEGLLGIIQSHEIWLTNTEFVNDTTECKAFEEYKYKELLSRIKIDGFTNPYIKEALEYTRRNSSDKYIASFSKEPNSLEQWRAYGSYCIGFKAKKLIKDNFTLHKCTYEINDIKDWIVNKSKAEAWNAAELEDMDKRMAAMGLIYQASIKVKDYNYKNEKEVRLFVVSHNNWSPYPNSPSMYRDDPAIFFRYHSKLNTPVPYVKFFLTNEEQQIDENEIDNRKELEVKRDNRGRERITKKQLLPIKEVIIGPMQHQKEAKVACKMLLHENGYSNNIIELSEIPYRGF